MLVHPIIYSSVLSLVFIIGCTDDDGAGETESSTTHTQASQSVGEGGNISASGAGDGVGTVELAVTGWSVAAGLYPGTSPRDTVDGWTVRYSKFLVTIGDVRAFEPGEPGRPAPEVGLSDGRTFVVDLARTSDPVSLVTLSMLPVGTFEKFLFETTLATATADLRLATSADRDLLVDGGTTIHVEGVITNPDGQSCDPAEPDACTPASSIAFSWSLPAVTRYTGCPGFDVESDQTTVLMLTLPGDRWFLTGFAKDADSRQRRVQWLADADLDRDGETTLAELDQIKAESLFRPELGYDLADAPVALSTARDFVVAQAHTLGLGEALGCSRGIPFE